ncbi:MAG: pentapeptide repeat-containing protein [Planctomycetes bacterium]|nr:pentapeptide repeat-containing protein [Planctomycetota bacterium]
MRQEGATWTRFRLGFPYARPTSDFCHAVVELGPGSLPGFREVTYEGQRYRLPADDKGSTILNPVIGGGCVGYLHQKGEGRGIIDHKGRQVMGQGTSMQLALALAVNSAYRCEEDRSQLPLVLLSGAIAYPQGAPPFFEARVKTYCSAEVAPVALLEKYRAAQSVSASFLVLPMRDALILQSELTHINEKVSLSPLAVLDSQVNDKEDGGPALLGVEEDELPRLASYLGISRYHYQAGKNRKFTTRQLALFAFTFLMGLLALGVGIHFFRNSEDGPSDEFLKRRHFLISTMYHDNYEGKRSRIRDEAVKEYIHRERKYRSSRAREHHDSMERIDLKNIDLTEADLHSCNLDEINFLKANFSRANLNEVSMRGAYLKGAVFTQAHLFKTDFEYSVLARVNFDGANLRGVRFDGCVGLEAASLKGALFDEKTVWPEEMTLEKVLAMGALLAPGSEKPVFINPLKDSKGED